MILWTFFIGSWVSITIINFEEPSKYYYEVHDRPIFLKFIFKNDFYRPFCLNPYYCPESFWLRGFKYTGTLDYYDHIPHKPPAAFDYDSHNTEDDYMHGYLKVTRDSYEEIDPIGTLFFKYFSFLFILRKQFYYRYLR